MLTTRLIDIQHDNPQITYCIFDLEGTLMWTPEFKRLTRSQAEACLSDNLNINRTRAKYLLDDKTSALSGTLGYKPALSTVVSSFDIPIKVWAQYQAQVNIDGLLDADLESSQYLTKLSEYYELLLYTNMAKKLASIVLKTLRIENSFSKLLFSEDFDESKPSISSLMKMISKGYFIAESTLSIGDRYHIDIEPIVSLGGYGFISDCRDKLLDICKYLISIKEV